MYLGVTGRDPKLFQPRQMLLDFIGASVLHTQGDLYPGYGLSYTPGVCPAWSVSSGDLLGVEWDPPCVTVYKNYRKLHKWETSHQQVWMAAELDKDMSIKMQESGS